MESLNEASSPSLSWGDPSSESTDKINSRIPRSSHSSKPCGSPSIWARLDNVKLNVSLIVKESFITASDTSFTDPDKNAGTATWMVSDM
jgi:hypothetical protein